MPHYMPRHRVKWPAWNIPRGIKAERSCIYTSLIHGCDRTGDGTKDYPLKTPLQAMLLCREGFHMSDTIFSYDERDGYVDLSTEQWKEAEKQYWEIRAQEDRDLEKENAAFDDLCAKAKVSAQKALSFFPELTRCKIGDAKNFLDQRVKLYGWIHQVRRSNWSMIRFTLRDGTGYLPCILTGELCRPDVLTAETSVVLKGKLTKFEDNESIPGGILLNVEAWERIGRAMNGGIGHRVKPIDEAHGRWRLRLNQRYIRLRFDKRTKYIKLTSAISNALHWYLNKRGYTQVFPPTLVHPSIPDAKTIFEVDYFGSTAAFSNSPHLYLETCLPAVGDCYSITPVFRVGRLPPGDKDITVYYQFNVECAFVDLDELGDRLEDLFVTVTKRLMETSGDLIKDLNPHFQVPETPFLRMTWDEALDHSGYSDKDYARSHHIHCMGSSVAGSWGKPVLVTHFTKNLRPFYMKKDQSDVSLVESIDLYYPTTLAESTMAGGSMRITDVKELEKAYETHNKDPKELYWYTDQRRFGSIPHGGFAIRLEEFCAMIVKESYSIETASFPLVLPPGKSRCC